MEESELARVSLWPDHTCFLCSGTSEHLGAVSGQLAGRLSFPVALLRV